MSHHEATTTPPLSETLAALAQGPDPAAWADLLADAGPDMQRLAGRIVGDAALADDALQEALLHIRDRAGKFRPTESGDPDNDARRWIMRLTANVCISLLRSRQRSRKRERTHGGGAPEPSAPHESLERSEQAALLRRELAQLPSGSSTAIVLHHVAGLSFEEIAAEMRIPIGTAKTTVRRGLMRLRQRLTKIGLTLSLAAVAESLTQLPAAEGGRALLAYSSLLTSPAHASVISAGGGVALASKIAIAAGVVAAAAAAPLVVHRAPAIPPPSTAELAPRTTVLAYDFEDGSRPSFLLDGELVAGPARDGNRLCVRAIDRPRDGRVQREIVFEPPRGVEFLTFQPGMRLDFDCWYSSDTPLLSVAGWSIADGASLNAYQHDLPQGRWIHVSVPIADFRTDEEPPHGYPRGGGIGNLALGITARSTDHLYIDNLTITKPQLE